MVDGLDGGGCSRRMRVEGDKVVMVMEVVSGGANGVRIVDLERRR